MLWIVATPIGNLEDASPRCLRALSDASVIACEDTRRTRALLSHFGIDRPRQFLSYRQGNEESVGRRLIDILNAGQTVALCSDGGCPAISDPGYRLIRLAVESGCEVSVVPGPSSVLTAMMLSGLPSSSFTFKGYPPRKPGPLSRFFDEEKNAPHTLVLLESPHRVAATLAAAGAVLGDREAAVCIEMTKKFERVARGYLCELSARFAAERVRGEVTIVIAGNHPKFARKECGSENADA
ncbi:MAG: 16S rRNA (cytidine(1402)-2'-O)-methyltransferase [Lentisphaerae bacterium]|nr:16S rRNA (cytidine(1402)-2'-O)-methyltransferase [Lentisphaerota bacterium]